MGKDDVPRDETAEMKKELLLIIKEDANPFEMTTYLLNAVQRLLSVP